jgi:hypothetical protein
MSRPRLTDSWWTNLARGVKMMRFAAARSFRQKSTSLKLTGNRISSMPPTAKIVGPAGQQARRRDGAALVRDAQQIAIARIGGDPIVEGVRRGEMRPRTTPPCWTPLG